MNRHDLAPASMRLLLVVSLLLAFVSIEQSAAPPVAQAATTTTLTNIPSDPYTMGQAVLVHYTVASAVQEIPTGRVTMQAGADTCTGLATAGACYLTFTSAGAKSLTATYSGDGAFYGSASAAVTHTVIMRSRLIWHYVPGRLLFFRVFASSRESFQAVTLGDSMGLRLEENVRGYSESSGYLGYIIHADGPLPSLHAAKI